MLAPKWLRYVASAPQPSALSAHHTQVLCQRTTPKCLASSPQPSALPGHHTQVPCQLTTHKCFASSPHPSALSAHHNQVPCQLTKAKCFASSPHPSALPAHHAQVPCHPLHPSALPAHHDQVRTHVCTRSFLVKLLRPTQLHPRKRRQSHTCNTPPNKAYNPMQCCALQCKLAVLTPGTWRQLQL